MIEVAIEAEPDIDKLGEFEQPERYRVAERHHFAEQENWRRWTPNTADRMAHTAPEAYRHYVDRSCDLTMRGGYSTGLAYPLAVCALAERYMFRSIGGTSAGAVAAAFTAAAEYGRFAEPTEPHTATAADALEAVAAQHSLFAEPEPAKSTTTNAVGPGFAGLAGIITWLVSQPDGERWRLAKLLQPHARLHKVFRLLTALTQDRHLTGRGRLFALLVATLTAVRPLARVLLVLLLCGWFAGPLGLALTEPMVGAQWSVAAPVAGVGTVVALWTIIHLGRSVGRLTVPLLIPLLTGYFGLALWSQGWASGLVAGAIVTAGWLVLSLAVPMALTLIYSMTVQPLILDSRRFRYGLVPGAASYRPNFWDRLAGMPEQTEVPPLATWIADRIDDLAGISHSRALTFGDLWHGPDRTRGGWQDRLPAVGDRVINLVLLATDLSSGRPYQLPFTSREAWQFCPQCLDGIVPGRIVDQIRTAEVDGTRCPQHSTTLWWLPDPADLPVALAVRMCLPLPGLICPVVLYQNGRAHWFTDGGISSGINADFFDTELPRWPTFALNLVSTDRVGPENEVLLPEQDASSPERSYVHPGRSIVTLLGRMIRTRADWSDTLSSSLPGFRGRIATITQGPGENTATLFASPIDMARTALRGRTAGLALLHRFSEQHPDEAPGFTRTDRYRWIKLRMTLREWRQTSFEVSARSMLYKERVARYPIPESLGQWFTGPPGPPMVEPHTAEIDCALDHMAALSHDCLAQEFDGNPPTEPSHTESRANWS